MGGKNWSPSLLPTFGLGCANGIVDETDFVVLSVQCFTQTKTDCFLFLWLSGYMIIKTLSWMG